MYSDFDPKGIFNIRWSGPRSNHNRQTGQRGGKNTAKQSKARNYNGNDTQNDNRDGNGEEKRLNTCGNNQNDRWK